MRQGARIPSVLLFADVAGVEKKEIGFRRILGRDVAHLRQGAGHLFRIVMIHLAAKGFDKEFL